jgi:hypothetical protein
MATLGPDDVRCFLEVMSIEKRPVTAASLVQPEAARTRPVSHVATDLAPLPGLEPRTCGPEVQRSLVPERGAWAGESSPLS